MSVPRTLFNLNGATVAYDGAPGKRLSEALRSDFGALDVKVGCNAGDCGACTVLIDGEVACACMVPAARVAGARVETLAGLNGSDALLTSLQQAFLRYGAAQCGICTPGMLMSALALVRANPQPSEAEVMDALSGVLCRCTGYRKIVRAVMEAGEPAGEAPRAAAGKAVGSGVERVDGMPKVDGSERFGDDVAPAGCLSVQSDPLAPPSCRLLLRRSRRLRCGASGRAAGAHRRRYSRAQLLWRHSALCRPAGLCPSHRALSRRGGRCRSGRGCCGGCVCG